MSNQEPNLYQAALKYIKEGIMIFPCAPGGKTPLTQHGHKDASADERQIKDWWSLHHTANIAAPAGPNGWTILDIDTDSRDEIQKIVEDLVIPRTAMVRTGRGYHIYFKGRNIRPSVSIMPHVDVRSGESYVILPPSVHSSGRTYRWQVPLSEISELPAELIEKISSRTKDRADTRLDGRKLHTGERRPELFRIARVLCAKGVVREAILVHLRAVNAARCDPPLPDEELVRTVDGSEKYGRLPVPDALPIETGEQGGYTAKRVKY